MSLIVGLDTETTGIEQSEGHRIIEIAMLTYDSTTRLCVDRYVQRIDPERAISSGAQAIHGISYEELVGQPKWAAVAPVVKKKMAIGQTMIAHNMGFDGPFVGAELIRVGETLPDIEPFCTMSEGRWACPDGKYPKLGELCFALGVEYDLSKAHAADYDVEVMMACFWRGLDRGFYTLSVPT